MNYVIYELVQPSLLKKTEQDGYYLKTTYMDVLQRLNVPHVKEEHPTMESAIAEIQNNKEHLKHLQLTILPVIRVSWDGEIS